MAEGLARAMRERAQMEPAGAPRVGVPWPARGGPGDGLYNRGLHDQQPHRSANSRVSMWSDGSSGQASPAPAAASIASAQDGNPSTERRPSPTGFEPHYKKVRSDMPQGFGNRNQGPEDQRDNGYDDGPPGLSHALSSVATGGQSYGALGGGESYGAGYDGQQMYGHGQGMPQMSGYDQVMSQTSSRSQGIPQSYGSSMGFAPGSAKGTGALFLKTKLCTKFKLGTCTFNERCHFAHGMEDLRKPPLGWETMVANAGQGGPLAGRTGDGGLQQRQKTAKPCRYFADGKNCPYGDRCTFLHGNEDVQQTPGAGNFYNRGTSTTSNINYKTRMCVRWERGELCNYGERCHYAHGHAELQRCTGVSSYSNCGVAMATNVQHSSAKPEMAPNPAVYSNPNIINPPPLAASYGESINFASVKAPASLNSYLIAGAGAQDDTNGSCKSHNYWNGPPTQQGYVQANQTAHGGHKEHISAVQYTQELLQQQQNAPFYDSGSAGVYQDTKQNLSAPFGQDGSEGNYQSEATNGNGVHYRPANEVYYPNQQADNSGRYNMAETWTGKM